MARTPTSLPRPRRVLVALAALQLSFFAACASRGFDPGVGRGLTTADAAAPAGVEVFERPTWKLGDRFTFRRGGKLRLLQSVIEAADDGYVVEESLTKIRTELGPDFQQMRESVEDEPWEEKRLVPGDWRLTWPLWRGKRWVCEYLFKTPGEDALPVVAEYHCDAREKIRTPAGDFDCLRVWRVARPAIEGRSFLDQVAVSWYAPSVGAVVRQLKNGTVTELESYQRQ